MRIDDSSIIQTSIQTIENTIRNQQSDSQDSIEKSKSTTTGTEAVINEPEADNKEKGVLRLLREGHFKGVADVRLRINFHDEISSMNQQQINQIAEEKVFELTESINTDLNSFLQVPELSESSPDTIKNLTEQFNSDVSQVLDNFLTSETPNKDNLISQLQASFEELKSTLESTVNESTSQTEIESTDTVIQNDLTLGADISTTIEENITEPRAETTQTLFQQLLAQLTDTFTTALNELETALNESNVLPEISAPHGNGRAYDKFLAIYNGLNGDRQSQIDPPTIDTLT